ncbi:hypothetical protein HD594_000153 [Microbacterium thalassium]|uniref:Uncharacterized protein n=1 Tax=Microbacterium thalassium TaxID=362649 RepID=A0A7X0FLP4_9MICO|nr:hypothetical protein [Microbacterium thalassium]
MLRIRAAAFMGELLFVFVSVFGDRIRVIA